MTWWHALIDAGAVPAAHTPPPTGGWEGGGGLKARCGGRRGLGVAPLDRLSPTLRPVLQQAVPDIEPVDGELVGQPARYLEQVESTVRRARAHLERELADAALAAL